MNRGLDDGAFFAVGLSAYTLGRQGILKLRAERSKTKLAGLVTALLATLVLFTAIVVLA